MSLNDDGTPLIHSGKESASLVISDSLTNQRAQGSRKPPVLPWPDISSRAKWSVSSFKFGFGAECLLDGDPDTFWQ
jgi:Anaphase-promoting complex, subunit 10 (APC10)